ncbi:hypothetical protein [Snuella sedimenti]|uniref:Uncharacterized protein n=1 Tax=Snuella sedimenti TaxID=2798802 RepID=A0A8J7IXP8_9FLAO|nr:hypothetical protein [Snuella sedimenti]MBJ6369205.1 hypothetical protein [Snuella sedimenti]
MKNTILNYALLIVGAAIALYANADEDQNEYILILGIVVLMLGVYRVSRTIPGRNEERDDVNDEL